MELPEPIYQKIQVLCEEAEKLIDKGKPILAIKTFQQAFVLLPPPTTDWEAGTWILTAIGDTYFEIQQFEDALQTLKRAELHPDGTTTSFLQLRIGQTYFELDQMDVAREYLLRAYLLAGLSIFLDEPPKYQQLIQELIDKDQSE